MYTGALSDKRPASQIAIVYRELAKGWTDLYEITKAVRSKLDCHASETSVSARVRDLRKAKFGGLTVETRRLSSGTWQYRIPS